MKRLKKFKLFEATEEMIQDIYLDFKDKVQDIQDDFDDIVFEVEIYKSKGVENDNYMISLWVKSAISNDLFSDLETFKVNDILPLLQNLNQFVESNCGLEIYHLISDTPNKTAKSRRKLEFPYNDVSMIYITWN
jgi:hypothetical protein